MEVVRYNQVEEKDRPFMRVVELKQLLAMQKRVWFTLGQILDEVQTNKYYEYWGHDSFSSFLGDPEVQIPISTAFSYLSLYRYYYLELKIPMETLERIPTKLLNSAISSLKQLSDDEAKEKIDSVIGLSFTDAVETLRESNVELSDAPSCFKEKGKWVIEVDERVTAEIRDRKEKKVLWKNA